MAHEVFISYSKKDKGAADAICHALEGQDIQCWYAPRNIRSGASWTGSIMDGIGNSQVMVLVWSSNSNASPDVSREVQHAFTKLLTVIPFRLEDIAPTKDLEYYLDFVQWLDASTFPLDEDSLQPLVEQVRTSLEGRKADEKRLQQAVDTARERTEAEAARQKADDEEWQRVAARKGDEEKRQRVDAEALHLAEVEAARQRAEAEERKRVETEARHAEAERRKADEEERQRVEAEARHAEAEAVRQRAKAEALRLAEAEAARERADEEERQRAEAEAARKRSEAEARQRADAERRKADEEKRQRAEAEARRVEEEAARKRAEPNVFPLRLVVISGLVVLIVGVAITLALYLMWPPSDAGTSTQTSTPRGSSSQPLSSPTDSATQAVVNNAPTSAPAANSLPNEFQRSYRGTINGLEFDMTLNRSGADLKGTASTTRSTDQLSGTIENDGRFRLDGYENGATHTGIYTGQVHNNGVVTGHWQSKDETGRKISFWVKEKQ